MASLPFCISCSAQGVGLYELADGRFQLIQAGPIAPLMFGRGYFLVEIALAQYLKDLNISRVRYEPAVIWHRGANLEYRTHVRMHVSQLFTSDQLRDLDVSGLRLLTLNDEYLFVSSALKERLHLTSFSYLRFSEGLEGFAGGG
jgi:hypothetical protein